MSQQAEQRAIEACAKNADGEHRFEERGYAGLGADGSLGVWWWACRCGLHVWHQRGNWRRGILAGQFVAEENAPKQFELGA